MAASVRQQLVERALTAEKLLEQLSPCLIKLKEATGALIVIDVLNFIFITGTINSLSYS